MATRIQIRRDTAANWALENPVLAAGELAFESDNGKVKCGDGVTAWNDLGFITDIAVGDFALADNSKATFGTSSDLQIFHDGSNSYVLDNGTGNLLLRGSIIKIGSPSGEDGVVFNTDGAVQLLYDNQLKLATTTTGVSITGNINASGNIITSGEFQATSDARLKSNIETLTNALDKVNAMRGVSYEINNKASVGVIAQEMLEVLPEVVSTDSEYLSVAYDNIIGVLIEAIKELSDKINKMEVSHDS